MIFDIIGIWNHKEPDRSPVEHVFQNRFYNRVQGQRRSFEEGEIRIDFYTRGENAFLNSVERVLIMIGDIYLNSSGSRLLNSSSHRLNVNDIERLYITAGLKTIDNIKGNYQLIIFDKLRNELLIFNSRFGVSPFYYRRSDTAFIFSTSLAAIQRYRHNGFDHVGIAEYALFGFPLGDRTFLEGIKCLRPATRLIVKPAGIELFEYWDPVALFTRNIQHEDEDDALDTGCRLFKQIVNAYADGDQKVCASLTGGFDGRAMLSVLDKDPGELMLYSFGIADSENIRIPQKICQETGFNYMPVYLDSSYEQVYEEFAMQALYQSDCLSTLERANYPYAFMKLSGFSPVFLTGIFGSELMRTFQNITVGQMLSQYFIDLNFAADKKTAVRVIRAKLRASSYYDESVLADEEAFIEHVYDECIARYGAISDNQRFFAFMLTESVRRYFGGEVQAERIYAVNRFPFLDDDFVDFVSTSPFAGFHRNPLRPTIGERYRSQYFYANLIKRYRPELLRYETDHGYPASYVLARYPLILIGPRYIAKRIRHSLFHYQEFKTEEWTRGVYHNRLLMSRPAKAPLAPTLRQDYETGAWAGNRLEFARAASLMMYFDLLDNSR